jgi:hypothetical protein
MTLVEAIESGKPFKRKYKNQWLYVSGGDIFHEAEHAGARLSATCICADDWELKPIKPREWWLRWGGHLVEVLLTEPRHEGYQIVHVREVIE